MTNEEKSRIVKMRGDGIGYKKIAQTLGLSEGTVKTFCHRNREQVWMLPKKSVLPFRKSPAGIAARWLSRFPAGRRKSSAQTNAAIAGGTDIFPKQSGKT